MDNKNDNKLHDAAKSYKNNQCITDRNEERQEIHNIQKGFMLLI